jgi:hypothetical protein
VREGEVEFMERLINQLLTLGVTEKLNKIQWINNALKVTL